MGWLWRWWRRLLAWPEIDWSPPLTRPPEPIRNWGLESDRRVDENYASSIEPMSDPYRWRPGDPL